MSLDRDQPLGTGQLEQAAATVRDLCRLTPWLRARPTLMTRQKLRAIATLLGALAGLALAGDDVGSTLHYLQTIPRGFQGLPRPANLDWIAAWAGAARILTGASWLMGLLTQVSLLGLALIVFRTLNPDFRLTPPVAPDAEPGAVLRQPIDRRRLRQIGAAMLLSLWLLGYLGAWLPWGKQGIAGLLLTGPTALQRLWPGAEAAASVGGQVLLLGGLWLVWGEAGLLRPGLGETRRIGVGRALIAAILAGIALTPFAIPLMGWAQAIATEVLQGMGGAARMAWLTYLGSVLVAYPLALATAGWTALSLARWSHFPWERRALVAGVTVAAAAWLGVGGLLRLAGPGRFDLGVPLARAAGVRTGPAGTLATLTLVPGAQPVPGLTRTMSGQGLTATDASARRVWAYLERRRFRTVHLFPALMHICQCEALTWNSDRFLEITLRSLERNPHPGFCQLLIEKLAHCPATPSARAALARLQDPQRFHLPPGGEREMATLRRSLGPEGADLSGRLLANGFPARGLRVGVINEALWQQLRGEPPALNHRLVVASDGVDETGAFRLRRVPAGRYLLLVAVPPRRHPWAALWTLVQGSPGPITVASAARALDVGTIRLIVSVPLRPRGRQREARGAVN
jgi:hypothetical protein